MASTSLEPAGLLLGFYWAFAGSCWLLLALSLHPSSTDLDTICNKHPLPFTIFSLLYFTSCGYSETKVKRKV